MENEKPNIESLEDVIKYFEKLVAEYTLIKRFVFGLSEEILTGLSDADYPTLVLEPPTKKMAGDLAMGVFRIYKINFSVFSYAEKDDFEKQTEATIENELIAEQLIGRFANDFNLDLAVFTCVPVRGFTHDNVHGWRVSFDLEIEGTLCKDKNWIKKASAWQ
jgi:hypothetical protein